MHTLIKHIVSFVLLALFIIFAFGSFDKNSEDEDMMIYPKDYPHFGLLNDSLHNKSEFKASKENTNKQTINDKKIVRVKTKVKNSDDSKNSEPPYLGHFSGRESRYFSPKYNSYSESSELIVHISPEEIHVKQRADDGSYLDYKGRYSVTISDNGNTFHIQGTLHPTTHKFGMYTKQDSYGDYFADFYYSKSEWALIKYGAYGEKEYLRLSS